MEIIKENGGMEEDLALPGKKASSTEPVDIGGWKVWASSGAPHALRNPFVCEY